MSKVISHAWKPGPARLFVAISAVIVAAVTCWFIIEQIRLANTPIFDIKLAYVEEQKRCFLVISNFSSTPGKGVTILLYPRDPESGPITSPTFNLSPFSEDTNPRKWEITGYLPLLGLRTKDLDKGIYYPKLTVDISFRKIYKRGESRPKYQPEEIREAWFSSPEEIEVLDELSLERREKKFKLTRVDNARYAFEIVQVNPPNSLE